MNSKAIIALAIICAALCAADLITGWAKAVINKNLSSTKSRNGIIKKGCMILVIGLCYGVDFLLEVNIFYEIMVVYYSLNEALSIVENLTEMGIPIPKTIKERLEKEKEGLEK